MDKNKIIRMAIGLLLLMAGTWVAAAAQENRSYKEVKKASGKVKKGFEANEEDTVARGYYDLGESFYQKGELKRSEDYFSRSKDLYEKLKDAEGIAKSSRALARVQEDLHKDREAIRNYTTAKDNSSLIGDSSLRELNVNDISRLIRPIPAEAQQRFLQQNIKLGFIKKDSGELVANFSRMAEINVKSNKPAAAIDALNNAYSFSITNPEQALRYNQRITDLYLGKSDFKGAIETKKRALNESFVQNSTELTAREMAALADIYILKKDDSTAINLLDRSYWLSVNNGHTLEARTAIEKLDTLYQRNGGRERSLSLYKDFVSRLPSVIARDSTLADKRIFAETESRIKELVQEKALKDDLLRRKNVFNYWLIGSVVVLSVFMAIVLYVLRKLRVTNKKIALQSLRREMNPHFIFNSLNSVNQFIANNNELEANRYLSRFSTLMRRVMENSREDFVLFSKELELLENYLELERSRFPDKFDFRVEIDDALLMEEAIYIPGMLVQPHLENAVWHGLRYISDKGWLRLAFRKAGPSIEIHIEDNGIGIAGSKKYKTENQKKRSGRGISNTYERIRILNSLYRQRITCEVEDKAAPERGVKVKIVVPYLKNI